MTKIKVDINNKFAMLNAKLYEKCEIFILFVLLGYLENRLDPFLHFGLLFYTFRINEGNSKSPFVTLDMTILYTEHLKYI